MLNKKEYEKEKNYLEKVLKILNDLLKDKKAYLNIREEERQTIRNFLLENTSKHTDEEDGALNLNTDIQLLKQHELLVNKTQKELYKLSKSLTCPYFGKVVFKEQEEMNIYVGLNTIENNNEFYVFDWRSNIASLFYNFELGKAFYNTQDNIINGEIKLKRQFKIKEGKMISAFDSSLNISDEYLMDILSTTNSEKMQNIVSTIQKEQNQVIRNLQDKNLTVLGCAGSGKSSVAMHRVAYLLYKDHSITNDNIIIFSPNNIFTEYISEVLPQLGEENVLTSTFRDFSYKILNNYNVLEEYSSFLERIYNSNIDKNTIFYKQSYKIKEDLDLFYSKYIKELVFLKSIKKHKITITKEELNYLLKDKYKEHNIKNRIDFILTFISRKLNINLDKNYNKLKEFITKILNLSINELDIYNNFLRSKDLEPIKEESINYEDVTPLIYLKFKINGTNKYNDIKYVLIDEVQDYTRLQIEILKGMFNKASFTILGDTNQTINPFLINNNVKDLLKDSKYITLNKTYRCTKEITDFANKILNINNVNVVRNQNTFPVVKEKLTKNVKTKILDDIAFMKENNFTKIAIITKNKQESNYIYNLLKEEIDITLLEENEILNYTNIIVVPSYLSKGLEFDGVIIYTDKNNKFNEEEKNLYYVACTRAQHILKIYNQ